MTFWGMSFWAARLNIVEPDCATGAKACSRLLDAVQKAGVVFEDRPAIIDSAEAAHKLRTLRCEIIQPRFDFTDVFAQFGNVPADRAKVPQH